MSNYKKFDLKTIKTKLANGEYAGRVGAMRAIGKTKDLSDKEKDKARALVDQYFPADEKPVAKKASKKAAKKAKGKTAGRKKAPKKAEPTPAPAPAVKKASKRAKKAARAKESASSPEADTSPEEKPAPVTSKAPPAKQPADRKSVLTQMTSVISSVSDSLKAMEAAKRMFPKAELERNVTIATGAMARAVQVIDKEITTPLLGDVTSEASPAGTRKKPAKKGTRPKAATATPKAVEEKPEEVEEPEGADEEPTESSEDDAELSEEEQAQLELARQTQAAG